MPFSGTFGGPKSPAGNSLNTRRVGSFGPMQGIARAGRIDPSHAVERVPRKSDPISLGGSMGMRMHSPESQRAESFTDARAMGPNQAARLKSPTRDLSPRQVTVRSVNRNRHF